MRRGGEAEEHAVLAADEPLAPGELEIVAGERVFPQPRAIAFVGGEAVDVVEAVGGRRRSLVRREIADQVGPAARNRLPPIARIGLERVVHERIDVVAYEACDHGAASSCWLVED